MPQCQTFAELYHKLDENGREKVKHALAKLSPYVVSDNIIKLKARLSKATISEIMKPILL